MKIFLTGQPQSGKSQLLTEFINQQPAKVGFLTPEVRKDDVRLGFDVITSLGETIPLARVNSMSPHRVSRYGVNVAAVTKIIPDLLKFKPEDFLYIDEIGEMEFLCPAFQLLVEQYLTSSNNFIATVSSRFDHPVINSILADKRYKIFTVTPENHELIIKQIKESQK